MKLPQHQIIKLKELIVKDYGVFVSDEEINEFGESLLRLTRVALNSSTKRIESDKKKEVACSTIEKTRSNQQVCEITKLAGQQGVLLRPKNGAGTEITPRGSVFPFRPSARGGHLATDGVQASSNPGVIASSDYTQPEENGDFVNPSRARNHVFTYIQNYALGRSKQTA
jgi:hypothetical protein